MGADSAIEWTKHSLNPWVGCTKVSPGCDHCYAEGWAKRTGNAHLWAGERRRTREANWRQAIKWNRQAEALDERHRVFCASLADVFDNQVPALWRSDLFNLIWETPNLDWMLLTKRPENIAKMLPCAIGETELWPWRNVWLGTTVEDGERTRRIDALRSVPAKVRFLSCEPLLEDLGELDLTGIDLVIVGGESGPSARPMHPDWARSIRDQCAAAGVAYFFKQWGEWAHSEQSPAPVPGPSFFDTEGKPKGAGWHFWTEGDQGANASIRIGKKAAGRLIDGIEYSEMPSGA